jgi:hypothetical protein
MAYFENGNKSKVLDKQCLTCPLGNYQCPVYTVQSLFNFDQMEEGNDKLRQSMIFLVDDAGVCQVKQLLDQSCQDLEQKYRMLHQYAFVLKQLDRRIAAL